MLSEKPSWFINDASKISDYQVCPRKYFYAHILGWRTDTPNIDLVFGDAWHLAMEQLLKTGYSQDSYELACMLLLERYRESFDSVMDDSYFPKSPAFAFSMLERYIEKYSRDHDEFEVLYTEISGSISLTASTLIHFKMDNILKWKTGPRAGKYFSLEHKTTKTIKPVWAETHTLKMQPFIYTHVLRCLYGDETDSVIYNVGQFQKTNPDFFRFRVPKTFDQMQCWYFEIMNYIDSISHNLDRLSQCSDSDPVLYSFPRNGESCTKYFRTCQYFDFCTSWANPLRYCASPPLGFTENFWDPRDIETTTKMDVSAP